MARTPNRWQAFVERVLPWYHPGAERLRDLRSEVIRRRSEKAIADANEVIAVLDDYQRADAERRR